MKNAGVSINRPTCTDGREVISINITDEDSNLTVLRMEMTLPDFAKALTGQASMPAIVGRWCGKYADKIGKKAEYKTMHLKGRTPYEKDRGAKWVRSHPELKKELKDGWELHNDGTGSQQNGRDTHEITLVRYVEIK